MLKKLQEFLEKSETGEILEFLYSCEEHVSTLLLHLLSSIPASHSKYKL